MLLRREIRSFNGSDESFNMIALIDIVFLLIIFFLVVSRFIDAENFAVLVPDDCDKAVQIVNESGKFVTVTVMNNSLGGEFAVGSRKIKSSNDEQLLKALRRTIDEQLGDQSSEKRVVALRIDGDVTFSRAQYALAAIAQSSATDIQLAALKYKRNSTK